MSVVSQIDQVQSIYIAYYGRPGDRSGIDYWAGRLVEANGSLDAIIDAFGTSQEYLDRFGPLSNAAMIDAFYQQIFNRTADPAGLSFYLDALDAGRMTLASIAKNIWDGALNDDAAITANKLAAGHWTTDRIANENRLYDLDDIDPIAAALAIVDGTATGLEAGLSALDEQIDALRHLDPQSFSINTSQQIAEGDLLVVEVTLPPFAGTAKLSYRTEAGSAEPGTDFEAHQGQLVFGPGETTRTIEIQTFADQTTEPSEAFNLIFSDPIAASLPNTAPQFVLEIDLLDVIPETSGATDHEQYFLELVNRARADPAAEAERFGISLNEGLAPDTLDAAPGQPLAFNPDLTDAARGHSEWMLATDIFDHTGASGSSPGDRIEAAGYDDWITYGENLAWKGSTGGVDDLTGWVADLHQNLFVDEGVPDRGHRVNLLNDAFRESGVGILSDDFLDYDAVMLTQDFGATDDDLDFLLGVVFADQDNDAFYTPGEGLGGALVTVEGGNGSYSTYTTTSGGYQLALPAGIYDVELTTPDGQSLTAEIEMAGLNEKLDWLL